MNELTSKQKGYLRGLAQRIEASGSVGKAGLTDAANANLRDLLQRHELVKVHIPAGSGSDRQAMGVEIAAATDAALVTVVGRMVVLYRPNEQLDSDRRIKLPPATTE